MQLAKLSKRAQMIRPSEFMPLSATLPGTLLSARLHTTAVEFFQRLFARYCTAKDSISEFSKV